MAKTESLKTLPADMYDALEWAAMMFGGIGYGTDYIRIRNGFNFVQDRNQPVCIHGLADFIEAPHNNSAYVFTPIKYCTISRKLYDLGINRTWADSIIKCHLNSEMGKISWSTFCELFNIVRGE